MYACLHLTGSAESVESPELALLDVAQQFSPRVTWLASGVLAADLRGLERLFGEPRAIGEALRGALADRGLRAHVALAATCTAARFLAEARAGLTVVPPGDEAAALASLPIAVLQTDPDPPSGQPSPPARFYRMSPVTEIVRNRRRREKTAETFRRWGVRTLGELAALPPADLAARLGAEGPVLQALARGEDAGPLVPLLPDERFEATLALEWPIEGLEPLSFVLGRLAEPVCAHLERRGRAAMVLHVELRLVTREIWRRRLDLPAPMKDARTFRTLALLDLESHPPPAGIDAVTLRVDPTPAPTLQHSLLERARPASEQVSTLVARLTALMGERRVGSPELLDSHRPGVFQMTGFTGGASPATAKVVVAVGPNFNSATPAKSSGPALRRFRHPVVATVTAEGGRPSRVRLARPDLPGGRVEASAGPWRTAGEWWTQSAWDHDEWDVALDDGTLCRLMRDRRKDRWYLEGVYD